MIEKVFNKLGFYLDNKISTVIIEGDRGVGKTEVVQKLFNAKFGPEGWRYYSGSTMDPFIDMIGCPIKTVDLETGKEFLDMIQPKDFALDKVRAIFIDEYNRSKEQVRNACLELIQFKRMNGKKFENLEFVWAAVNPDNGDYQVDKIDPAQQDRFIVYLKIPYNISKVYFNEKYPELAAPACEWWENLPVDIRKKISPRRLDYALDMYIKGGELEDVLDEKSNPTKLASALKSGSYIAKFNALKKEYEAGNIKVEKMEAFLSDPNNFFNLREHVLKSDINYSKFFNEENISNILSNNDKLFDHVMTNLGDIDKFSKVVDSIVSSNTNANLAEKIKTNPKYVEYSFLKDEPEDPRCKELEAELEKLTDRQEVYDFIEKNKKALVGSEKTIYKIAEVNTSEYDVNSDELAIFIMMDGLQN